VTPTPGGTTHRRTLRWQTATVLAVHDETPRARTLRLALPEPRRHLAGQHYVLRLTAPDGYTASRSYSVASAPDDTGEIELTIEKLVDGEVSEFVHDVVLPGDELEVRGPIGGFFAWAGDSPALLVGGGSGVVPLMAMLRLARRTGRADLVRMVVSVRSPEDLYYAAELPGPQTTVVYTRVAPPGAPAARPARRRRRGCAGPWRRGRLRVRLGRLRRGRDHGAAGRRGPGRADQGGAVRPIRLNTDRTR
jgi:ferredoxin-NADP reductase